MTTSSMRIAIVALLACVGLAHAEVPRPVARAFLDNGIPMTHVAIVVQEVGKPRPLFAFDPDRPMNPASVMKLVTTFAALEILGPDYQWKTEAYAGGPIADGTLHGDLILKGYGDPKITVEQWQSFIASLRDTGLTTIDGDLGLDRSSFQLPPHDPAAFDGEALRPYNVGPDALLVNFKSVRFVFAPNAANEVELRMEPPLPAVAVGALPAPAFGECSDWRAGLAARFDDHPDRAAVSFPGRYPLGCDERDLWVSLLDHPHYVYQMFTAYFNEAGGHFAGGLKEKRVPRGAKLLATLESPPLYDIVRDVNKLSNNVMARQIFLSLALATTPPPATVEKATETVKRWLARRKLSLPDLVLENGSGLSRHERITASGLMRLLLAADQSRVRDEFASSLAVAAVDGTVQRRFQNGTVAGQALLKTGSLEGVRALAGYVIDADGRRFALVAIINDPNAARGAPALDALVQWVYRNGATWTPARQR